MTHLTSSAFTPLVSWLPRCWAPAGSGTGDYDWVLSASQTPDSLVAITPPGGESASGRPLAERGVYAEGASFDPGFLQAARGYRLVRFSQQQV